MITFAIVFYVVFAYLLAGVSIAMKVDEAQMREHVPFGDFPSKFTLQQIRAVVFFFFVVAGPVIFVEAFLRRLWVRIRPKPPRDSNPRYRKHPRKELGGIEHGH